MDLQHPIAKVISFAAFAGLVLVPQFFSTKSETPGAPSQPEAPTAKDAKLDPSRRTDLGAIDQGQGTCPRGMILVSGDYCPDVEQVCVKWLDPPPYQNLRCAEYAKPVKCKSARQKRRFCIDREEYTDAREPGAVEGEALPVVQKRWGEAKALCEARGARLCKESEWEFACEGTDMSPYPYGFKRDATICNFDRTDLGGAEDKLTDHRAPLSAFPECVSPFGVHNMVGNVDEWVERENSAAPNRSALRGGWWLPGRNRCRAATLGHDESYSGKQVGFRCCKDVT